MLGDSLQRLCQSAATEILLVAPFVKAGVIERILRVVHSSVSVSCVTRWRAEEIAAGVSDLEVWDMFRENSHRNLFLCHNLHAKVYRADDTYLIGSANLTAAALGYSALPNLELLVEVPASMKSMIIFEQTLWRATVQVDEEVYREMKSLVASLPVAADTLPQDRALSPAPLDLATWTPRTRQPEDILAAYQGKSDLLSTATAETTAEDLAMLCLPAGLDEDGIRLAAGLLLLQTPIAHAVDRFISVRERRFGEVADLLVGLNPRIDADREWQTLFRWLMYFKAGRYIYRRPRHSELISRSS